MATTQRPDLRNILEHFGITPSRMIRCPFHGERRASCSVDYGKGLWNCHACGVGGDGWSFIMQMNSMTYAQAVQWAKDEGLMTESDDSGDEESGSGLFGRRSRPGRKGNRKRPYVPSWKRR